ncbi:MAG: FAD-dependent oxidoreductase [Phycisphaerae bacterium]
MDVDYFIVGAGLAGASTGYYLKQRTRTTSEAAPRVVVVEKEELPGVHSSGRNASQIRRHVDDHAIAELVRRGADVLVKGQLAEFHRTGSVLIGRGSDDASAHFPMARGQGLWCPDDGVIDVAGLLSTYLGDLDVRYGTEVTGWDDAPRSAGSPTAAVRCPLRVHTNHGDIDTGVLINAAGAWAGILGKLPLTPTNRHLFITPPTEAVRPDWPYVWDVPNGLYFRPESGGLLLCACDESPAEPGCYDEDQEVAARLEELVRTLQPGLGEIRIMRSWVGQRTFAADRRFVIGYDPRDRRIFHVAGLGGYGVSTAPAVGALAADMLLDESGSGPHNPFDPARLLE